jgi:hypothetical protein
MTPKKRKRVVTPDETRPTKKLSHANANNLQTFQAAINKAVPITLDRTNIFKWLQDDDKPSKTYGCPYNVKKLATNGFAPISYVQHATSSTNGLPPQGVMTLHVTQNLLTTTQFGLVSEFLRERSPAMIVRQLVLGAQLNLRVGTRDGPTLSTLDDGRKETDYQS